MKVPYLIGILLIALGVLSLMYQGFTYTTREKVIDIGPIEASKETKNRVPLPPILGGLALAGGVALVIAGSNRR
jgi:hypothetical protein